MDEYGLGVMTALTFDQAVSTTRLLLKAQGFRILSEMPAPPALTASLQPPGTGGRQHLFMSVWQRTIQVTNLGGPGLDVGDHLPCNVAVFEAVSAAASVASSSASLACCSRVGVLISGATFPLFSVTTPSSATLLKKAASW